MGPPDDDAWTMSGDAAAAVPDVEGLRYIPEVISPEDEASLVSGIETLELHPFVFRGIEARRRIAAFGVGYSFDRRALTEAPPVPPVLQPLAERVAHLAGIAVTSLAEALVTDYPIGAGIGWHRDAPPFDVIVGVSLLSPCLLRLRRYVAAGQSRRGQPRPVALRVAPRSAYVLAGRARTDWEHSIDAAITRRVSITFRTLRRSRHVGAASGERAASDH